MSDSVTYDKVSGTTRNIGPEVTAFFKNNRSVQASMGYNASLAKGSQDCLFTHQTKAALAKNLKRLIPIKLQEVHGGTPTTQVAQLQITKHDRVIHASFVAWPLRAPCPAGRMSPRSAGVVHCPAAADIAPPVPSDRRHGRP
ncbi:hypothetical protein PtB15_3B473 [Puccinia triticina]|nr:hypothetical protein PtB15_3B473 [Puccinia triticina]